MEERPFKDLAIDDASFLDDLEGRTPCSKCGRTRKYYCYTCYVPVGGIQDRLPKVKLPMKIDVIKHPSEVDGKSTAVHAAVICPEDVSIYTYPVIPHYPDPSKVMLIFPGENSVTLEELFERLHPGVQTQEAAQSVVKSMPDSAENSSKPKASEQEGSQCTVEGSGGSTFKAVSLGDERPSLLPDKDKMVDSTKPEPARGEPTVDPTEGCMDTLLPGKRVHEGQSSTDEPVCKKKARSHQPHFERVVFIDSTWNQTMKIYKDERLGGLQQVELKSRTTKFWRHQRDKPSSYLATIEAIYYFFQDYHRIFIGGDPQGCYDNLLFFFTYMYKKIRTLYSGGDTLKAYKNKSST